MSAEHETTDPNYLCIWICVYELRCRDLCFPVLVRITPAYIGCIAFMSIVTINILWIRSKQHRASGKSSYTASSKHLGTLTRANTTPVITPTVTSLQEQPDSGNQTKTATTIQWPNIKTLFAYPAGGHGMFSPAALRHQRGGMLADMLAYLI